MIGGALTPTFFLGSCPPACAVGRGLRLCCGSWKLGRQVEKAHKRNECRGNCGGRENAVLAAQAGEILTGSHDRREFRL